MDISTPHVACIIMSTRTRVPPAIPVVLYPFIPWLVECRTLLANFNLMYQESTCSQSPTKSRLVVNILLNNFERKPFQSEGSSLLWSIGVRNVITESLFYFVHYNRQRSTPKCRVLASLACRG